MPTMLPTTLGEAFSACALPLLAILILFSFPSISRRFLDSKPKLINNLTTARREKEPNFGYNNVKVSKLLIHPIKSCRGTSVESCRYTSEGLEYDRIWCIIDATTHATVTAREVPKMVLITPKIVSDDMSPYGGILNVSFPEGSGSESFSIPLKPTDELVKQWELIDNISMWGDSSIDGYICKTTSDLSASEILSKYMERPVHLAFKGKKRRGCAPTASFPDLKASVKYQDGYPLLVLSEESVSAIEDVLRDHVGKSGIEEKWKTGRIDIERFRPNIVFSGAGAFAEDGWEEIAFGPDMESAGRAPGVLIVSKCARCLLPNVSPETGIRDPAVPYKVLVKFRLGVDCGNKWKPCVGCNGSPRGNGTVRVGDVVSVRKVL
ncbi:hypothetical protein L218DRAFT_930541 [Marasmius fiardii PR-910]|nr:hypothetical protein L218DRAFT_930541 [Marasmius fiardii PR-910]